MNVEDVGETVVPTLHRKGMKGTRVQEETERALHMMMSGTAISIDDIAVAFVKKEVNVLLGG